MSNHRLSVQLRLRLRRLDSPGAPGTQAAREGGSTLGTSHFTELTLQKKSIRCRSESAAYPIRAAGVQ